MASYITLTTPRMTRPDLVALMATIRTQTGDPTAVLLDPGETGTWRGKKATTWTAPQIAAAQTALDTIAALTPAMTAQRQLDGMPLWEMAAFLLVLDQVNIIRARLVPPLGAITPAQFLDAIKAKVLTL